MAKQSAYFGESLPHRLSHARMMRLPSLLLLVSLLLAATWPIRLAAQEQAPFVVSADSLGGDYDSIRFPLLWKFNATDDPAFADPAYDDSGWPWEDARLLADQPFPDDWQGLGWFRLPLRVDSVLHNVPLGLQVEQFGASEIYLDGDLLHRLGQPSAHAEEVVPAANPAPVPLVLSGGDHVLTVRYANPSAQDLHDVGYGAGFSLTLGQLAPLVTTHAETVRTATLVQIGLTGMYVVFGLLHLFFFAFYPQIRENLFFSIVAFCIALISFNNFHESFFYSGPAELILIRRLWSPLALVGVLTFTRFIYAVYTNRPPRRFYVFLGIASVLAVWGFINPNLGWWPPGGRTYAYLFTLILEAEMLHIAFGATVLRREGPLTIALGVLAFVMAFSYPVVVTLGLAPPVINLLFFSNFVILGLLLAISVYLSRRFAQTNITLQEKLEEVARLSEEKLAQERLAHEKALEHQRLEAEYEVKLQELEEARMLQLSMLPESVPEHPTLELAAYMQTATEVGGDYYDFATDDDGTLTLAVGDATGHGMKAGTMVTATKSLFNALGQEHSLLGILDRSTRALKDMNMRQLYMALTLAKFKDGRLRFATAGMPPTLVYRAATGKVETIRLKGMPLGSFVGFPYKEKEMVLAAGDTVLFMSDGFPELFNEAGEMLGYDHAVEVFAEVAAKPVSEIIEELVSLGRSWSAGRPPDDDITFVVLKVRA